MAGYDDPKLILSLVEAIYDAALTPAQWPGVTAAITAAMNGAATGLLLYHPGGSRADLMTTHGYSAEALETYQRDFAGHDGRQRQVATTQVGQVLADGHNLDFAEYRRTRIFNEFFAPQGLEYGMGVPLLMDANRVGVLSMLRSAGSGAFTAQEVRMMEGLAPHLRRALQVHEQMARTAVMNDGLTTALDHIPSAAFLVEEHGQVGFMNGAAEQMLREPHCPLFIHDSRLSARGSNDVAMTHLIAAATLASRPPPAVLRLNRPDGLPPVAVMAVPVRTSLGRGFVFKPRVLVFASGGAHALDATLLSRQFGLTKAEAAVVVALMQDLDTHEIANRRGVSEATVRTQVKTILGKTDTRSQRQLATLVARSLAALTSRRG